MKQIMEDALTCWLILFTSFKNCATMLTILLHFYCSEKITFSFLHFLWQMVAVCNYIWKYLFVYKFLASFKLKINDVVYIEIYLKIEEFCCYINYSISFLYV